MKAATGALLVVAITAAAPAVASAQDGAARFDRASDAMAAGRHDQAATLLVALADELPADDLADDALFAAAGLYEEKLARPARAAALYRRLVEDYADSRVALAASRRLERLSAVMDSDADAGALAAMNRVLYADPALDPAAAIAAMEQVIAEHADWSGRSEAEMWLAGAYERAGRDADARRLFEAVAAGEAAPATSFEALRRAASIAARAGDYADARALVARMRADGDAGREASVRATHRLIDREELRARLYLASFIVLGTAVLALAALVGWLAGGPRPALRALGRPPTEVWFMLPVALILVGAAFTGHAEIAPAVVIILTGALVLLWLGGAAMRHCGSRRWVLLASPLASIAGIAAVSYVALHRTRLVDLIVSTVRFGPDV